MKRDELIKLGLTEDQATAVLNAYADELKGYVPQSRLSEVIEERNGLKDQIKERDKQIETLKASAGDNQALKDQIAELQKQNSDATKEYEGKITQLRLDNAVDVALSGAKAKNTKAVRALLDLTKAKVGEDGKVEGLDAQIKAIQKSDAYLFESAEATPPQTPGIKGVTPKDSGNGNPAPKATKDMSYAELCEYMAAGGKIDE